MIRVRFSTINDPTNFGSTLDELRRRAIEDYVRRCQQARDQRANENRIFGKRPIKMMGELVEQPDGSYAVMEGK